MSSKKSTKSSVKLTKTANLFAVLDNIDSDSESHKESTIDVVKQIKQEQQEKIKLDEDLIRSGSVVVIEDTKQNNTYDIDNEKMLNISENIKVSEFVATIKPKSREHGRFDEKMLESKEVYDDNINYGDIGNDLKLNSHWTVWVHNADNADWTLKSYQPRYLINSIGSFWRFFNNFQFYDSIKNQIFIMRGEIAPIWEDVNNKFGGICSIKVDSNQRGFKTDISTEIFIAICMLVMNETFIQNNDDINGISYTVKKRGILIKLWTKTFHKDETFVKELPKQLINKFNTEIQKQINGSSNNIYKMSIQYKQIKPEYEINS